MSKGFDQKIILRKLVALLGEKRVAVDDARRLAYSRDLMSRNVLEFKAGEPPHLPDIVCWPETREEVSQIVKIAFQRKIPVIPFGAGSGVSGGTLPILGGIIMDLTRMDHCDTVKERKGLYPYTVDVQSGIYGIPFEEKLGKQGFTLGHFPSSILCATVGGYIACRGAGQLSSRYGKIEDMVEDVEVVLPTGQIVPIGEPLKSFPAVRKKDIFTGSEGCLGIVTKARLKVVPTASHHTYRGVRFPSLKKAYEAMQCLLQEGLKPSVLRLYDPLDTLLLSRGYSKPTPDSPLMETLRSMFGENEDTTRTMKAQGYHLLLKNAGWVQKVIDKTASSVLLILGFEGEQKLIKAQEKWALWACDQFGGKDLGEGPGQHWLKNRYGVSYKMPKVFGMGCFVDTIEVATTWDNLSHLYEEMRNALTPHVLLLAHFSHAYPEGCSIYFTFLGYTGDAQEDLKKYQMIWNQAMETALRVGATISHHHGIGLLKAKYMSRELNGAMPLLQAMKKKLDPMNIMNPGKMGLQTSTTK